MEISYYKSITVFTDVEILTGETEQEFTDNLNDGIYEPAHKGYAIIDIDTGNVVGNLNAYQEGNKEYTDFELV
jgi:hypothetical protein